MYNGAPIKQIREKSGLTQEDFAARIGCKQNTLSQYESGKAAPSIKKGLAIVKIARRYKITTTLEELMEAIFSKN